MVPRHRWHISRRLDIDICIYVTDTTNHHCMYRQIVSILIHRMIMLTTTYYVPTASPSSSATRQLKLRGIKKQQRRTKKILTRGSWGPFATNTTIIHTLRDVAPTFAKEQLKEQSKVILLLVAPLWRISKGMDGSAYACSSHHNPAGEIENFQ